MTTGVKISELDEALNIDPAALIEIVQGGENLKVLYNLLVPVISGIGRVSDLNPVAGADLNADPLAVIGSVVSFNGTNLEMTTANGPDAGLADGDPVEWHIFTIGTEANIAQLAFCPQSNVEKAVIRYGELASDNVFSAWTTFGGGGVDPALEAQVEANTAKFLPEWQDVRNINNFDFTGGFPIGVTDTDGVRVNGAPYLATVFSQPPPAPLQYDLVLINIFPRFFAGLAAFEQNVGWDIDRGSICTIAENRIAIFNGTDLRVYRIDLNDVDPIAQIGNTYNGITVAVGFSTCMSYLAENEFSFFDADSNELIKLTFDGVNVTPAGNPLPIVGATAKVRSAKLNATDIAIGSQAEDNLRLARFDGVNWSIISTLPVTYNGLFDITSLNSDDVLIATDTDATVRLYNLKDDSFSYSKDITTYLAPTAFTISDDLQGDGYITTRLGLLEFTGYDKIEYDIANPEYSDRQGPQIAQVPSAYMRKTTNAPASQSAPVFTQNLINCGTEVLSSSFFTSTASNVLEYTGTRTFLAKLSGSVSFKGAGLGTGTKLQFAVWKNGSISGHSFNLLYTEHTVQNITDYVTVPLPCVDMDINEGDNLGVFFSSDSGAVAEFDVTYMDLNVAFKGWI